MNRAIPQHYREYEKKIVCNNLCAKNMLINVCSIELNAFFFHTKNRNYGQKKSWIKNRSQNEQWVKDLLEICTAYRMAMRAEQRRQAQRMTVVNEKKYITKSTKTNNFVSNKLIDCTSTHRVTIKPCTLSRYGCTVWSRCAIPERAR